MTTSPSRPRGSSRTKRASPSRSGSERRPSGSGPVAGETRDERKSRTRRALLDAALDLLEHENFSALSLREVARAAGIVPTAFYRHFHDMDELGLALVDESIGSLHGLLVAAREGVVDNRHVIRSSLAILVEHVHAHRSHFRFVAQERSGGAPVLRQAIHREIKLFTAELAIDLARDQTRATWPSADIQMLADLLVTVIVSTIESLLDVHADQPDAEAEVVELAVRQMTVVVLGAAAWKPKQR